MEMSDEDVGGSVASEGPTMRQLVETKLEELRMVDGVTSALQYWRKSRQPLNKSMINVRIAGRSQPVTVHCKVTVPNLLAAVHQAAEDVAKVLGSDAVAEGRRRYGAELEAAAPTAAPAASEATRPADQPLNFFLHSKLVRELDAKLVRANDRVIVADGAMRAAKLRVAEEEKAVKLAQQRLADARAAADMAEEPLAEAKAEAAELLFDLLPHLLRRDQQVGDFLSAVRG